MYEFCPMCFKTGKKSKIKAFQINLQEATWLCESPECIWPFRYKNLEYFSRPVGEKWSYDWDVYKIQECNPKQSTIQDIIFDTPPDTPVTDVICKDVQIDYVSTSDNITTTDKNSLTSSNIFLDHNYVQFSKINTMESSVSERNNTSETNSILNQSNEHQNSFTNNKQNLNSNSWIKGVPVIRSIESAKICNHIIDRLFPKENVNLSDDDDDDDDIESENNSKFSESKLYEKFTFEKILSQKVEKQENVENMNLEMNIEVTEGQSTTNEEIVVEDEIVYIDNMEDIVENNKLTSENLIKKSEFDIENIMNDRYITEHVPCSVEEEINKNNEDGNLNYQDSKASATDSDLKLEDLLSDISNEKYQNYDDELDLSWLNALFP